MSSLPHGLLIPEREEVIQICVLSKSISNRMKLIDPPTPFSVVPTAQYSCNVISLNKTMESVKLAPKIRWRPLGQAGVKETVISLFQAGCRNQLYRLTWPWEGSYYEENGKF